MGSEIDDRMDFFASLDEVLATLAKRDDRPRIIDTVRTARECIRRIMGPEPLRRAAYYRDRQLTLRQWARNVPDEGVTDTCAPKTISDCAELMCHLAILIDEMERPRTTVHGALT